MNVVCTMSWRGQQKHISMIFWKKSANSLFMFLIFFLLNDLGEILIRNALWEVIINIVIFVNEARRVSFIKKLSQQK